MRLCVAVALVSILANSAALAAPKGKGKGKRGKKKEVPAGPNMDTKDPVYTEKSEDGRYAPKGVTGELKEEEEREQRKRQRPKKRFVPPPRDPFILFGDAVLGFGKSPKPGPDVDGETQDATLVALSLGAAYDVSDRFTAGVRIPWTTASMELPNGVNSEQEMAFGSPLVFGEYRLSLSRVTTLPILFGVGVPIAQGDPDPNTADDVGRRRATVNLLADAAQGWRDSELYGVGRVPIVVGVGVRYLAPDFEFHAYDKLVVGIDLGTDLVPVTYPSGGSLVLEKTAIRNVTLAGFTYDLTSDPVLWAGLDAWLAYTPVQAIDFESDATDPTPLQFVAEPRVGARFGKLRPSLGLVFPIGGRLADSGISGVRLHVDYAF